MKIPNATVSDVMSRPPVVIDPECTVSEVLALAESREIHHFPIVENGALVGIVCTCDLRDARPLQQVRAYARSDVATVTPTRTTVEAARLMAWRAVGSAVVVGAEGVCGIVTREDLQDRIETKGLLEEGHCVACHSYKHLRSGPDGTFLCADCAERARGDNWFETSAGD